MIRSSTAFPMESHLDLKNMHGVNVFSIFSRSSQLLCLEGKTHFCAIEAITTFQFLLSTVICSGDKFFWLPWISALDADIYEVDCEIVDRDRFKL